MSEGIWNRLKYVLSPQFDIYKQLSNHVSRSVLDIGSGTGFGTQLLSKNASSVVGIDTDPLAVDFAQKAFGHLHNVEFYQSDAMDVQGKYETITMVDVIEHIHYDSVAVNCVASLLALEGVFYCTTPNSKSRYRKSECHIREYTPGQLFHLLSKGFESVELLDFHLSPLKSNFENPLVARCTGPKGVS